MGSRQHRQPPSGVHLMKTATPVSRQATLTSHPGHHVGPTRPSMTRSARHDALTAGDSASGAATTVSVSTAVATVESGGDVTGLASARGVAAGGIAIAVVAGVVTTAVTPGAAMTVKTAVTRAAAWTGTVCGTCPAFGRFLGVPAGAVATLVP